MRIPATKSRGWMLFFSALLAVLWIVFPIRSVAQNQQKQANLDGLRDKAWKEGTVGVIVHVDVPWIQELTAESARFSGMDANQAIAAERISADNALKEAIEYAAWRVFMELEGTPYTVNQIYSYIPFTALRVSPNALSLLETSSTVLGIEEDVPIRLIDPVEDSGGAKGAASLTDGGDLSRSFLGTSVNLIGAKTAWDLGYTGSGWYVAVLDTGIRKTHQFFTGKNIVEACFALGSDGVSGAGDCPNGNSTMTGSGAAAHYPSNYYGYDHGTHVSGIAAGNYGSLAGVAKDANIIAVQIFSKFTGSTYCGSSSPCLLSWSSDQLDAMNYIYSIRGNYNIAAINLSLGGGRYYSACDSDSTKSGIDLLRSAGIASAIATGNNYYCDSISKPACVSTSVAVGSSTKSDAESYFNNWHPTMQKLFAPGSSIYSSTGDSDSSYASWSGTSMATPHVAGAWALMKQASPGGSVTDFLNALRTTGVGVTSICDNYSTAIPRIQVDKAIQALSGSFALTIEPATGGTTSPAPGTYIYASGSQVQVTAIPDAIYEFVAWTGHISSTQNPVTITINGNMTIKANFRVKPKLTIQSNEFGTTNPSPGVYYYATGTQVLVTAVPNTNCEFVNWTGDISSSQNPVTITMNDNNTIKANFRLKPKLTIQSNEFGTTNPSPGVYYYATGTQVQISPIPNTYCIFISWSGDATGSTDPLVITMNSDKSISAYFRYIHGPIATGRKVLNRTFSQAEYINILSWRTDPANEGLDIALYRIYTMSGETPTLLVELTGDQIEYYHRQAGQTSITYAIRAVTSSSREGAPALVTVQ